MDRVLHVFRDPSLDGPTNMARDEHLLHCRCVRPACIRIYGWQPATISLGYFQRFSEVLELPAELRALAVVRRITGGGAILHDREVTYSLVLDDSVPVSRQAPTALYALVHGCWRAALVEGGVPACAAPAHLPMPTPRNGPFFCFERPARTDLLVGGEKLLGSAQRRVPGGVLQHGSLLLGQRFASHPGANLGDPPADTVAGWIDSFLYRLAAALGLRLKPACWTAMQLADVMERREKYVSAAWTRRR